jgi:hypothetical protein
MLLRDCPAGARRLGESVEPVATPVLYVRSLVIKSAALDFSTRECERRTGAAVPAWRYTADALQARRAEK